MSKYFLEILSLFTGIIGTILLTIVWKKFFNFGYDDKVRIQKVHSDISIRIGGLIIIILFLFISYLNQTFEETPIFLLCFIPLILVSSLEDFFQNISIKTRFISISLTAFLLVYLTDTALTKADLELANILLSYNFIAILFTTFGIITTCNAWNFIDGLNGISSGLAATTLLIFSILNLENNTSGFNDTIIIFSFLSFGFCIVNLVKGNVFLGDTGSYFFGTIIGWSGVVIVNNNSEISPWAIFLVIIYPASEIIISVFRRLIKKKSPFQSDNMHLHTILYSILKKHLNLNIKIINSISGFLILILASLPGIYCLLINGIYPNVIYAVFICFFLFTILYLSLRSYLVNLEIEK